MLSGEFLRSLSRKELQALAKEHGHKANASSAVLIDKLQVSSTSPPDSPVAVVKKKAGAVTTPASTSPRVAKSAAVSPAATPVLSILASTSKGKSGKSSLRSRGAPVVPTPAPPVAASAPGTSTPCTAAKWKAAPAAAVASTAKKVSLATPQSSPETAESTPRAGGTAKKAKASTIKKRTSAGTMSRLNTPLAAAVAAAASAATPLAAGSKLAPHSGHRSSTAKRRKSQAGTPPLVLAPSPVTVLEQEEAEAEAEAEAAAPQVSPLTAASPPEAVLTTRTSLGPELDLEAEVHVEVEVEACDEGDEDDEVLFGESDAPVPQEPRSSLQSMEWAAVLGDDGSDKASSPMPSRTHQSANANTLDAPTVKKAPRAMRQRQRQTLATPKVHTAAARAAARLSTPSPIAVSFAAEDGGGEVLATPSRRESRSLPGTPTPTHNPSSSGSGSGSGSEARQMRTPLRSTHTISHVRDEALLRVLARSHRKELHSPQKQAAAAAAEPIPRLNKAAQLMMAARQARVAELANRERREASAAKPGLRLAAQLQRHSTMGVPVRPTSAAAAGKRASKASLVPACATVRTSAPRYQQPEVPAFKAKAMPNFQARVPVVSMSKKALDAAAAAARGAAACAASSSSSSSSARSGPQRESKENAAPSAANKASKTKPLPFKLSISNRATAKVPGGAQTKSKAKAATSSSPTDADAPRKTAAKEDKVRGKKTPAKNPFEPLAL